MALTKCCCCVDLLKGVKILGIVLATLHILGIILNIVIVALYGAGSYFGVIGSGGGVAVNLLLVLAEKERKRVFLLPW